MCHLERYSFSMTRALSASLFTVLLLGSSAAAPGEPIRVRFEEGLVHGFLALRTLDGAFLAHGDLYQTARKDVVTTRLVFRFKDGSHHEETAVYSQAGHFRLLKSHIVQKGPAFERSLDATIDVRAGKVTIRSTDKDGKEDAYDERMELPDDLANGLLLTILKNIVPSAPKTVVSMLAITPKPRLVKLEFSPVGEEPYQVLGDSRRAMHYLVKIDIGGVTGAMASLLGKVPPDSHVWIDTGEAPAFVKSESPLYVGGPLWRIELARPLWPRTPAGKDGKGEKEDKDDD
jgi:hypothetical protein